MKKLITSIIAITLLTLVVSASAATITLSHGANGYTRVIDTFLNEGEPDASSGDLTFSRVDGNDSTSFSDHALIEFSDIFGYGINQLPLGSQVVSAILTLHVVDSGGCGFSLHQMLAPWSESDSWNDWVGGIAADDLEAKAAADVMLDTVSSGELDVDVTASLQRWASGETNYGWVLLPKNPSDGDGWEFTSSDGEIGPVLTVSYVPEPATMSILALGGLALLRRRSR